MPDTSLPSFVEWASFPFEGNFRVKRLDDPVAVEPPRMGDDKTDCVKCHAPDSDYIWVNENWRVRSMDRPSGLPMVLILESRSHLDLGDLPNMLAAELGVMTVRLERAIRSLDGVARVHVNRWGDAAAHLHLWFMARPQGRLQLRGTFLTMWEEILPPMPEAKWQENLALVAAWLAEFGGQPLAQPPRIEWKAPSSFAQLGASGGLHLDEEPADRTIPAAGAAAPSAATGDPSNAGDSSNAGDPNSDPGSAAGDRTSTGTAGAPRAAAPDAAAAPRGAVPGAEGVARGTPGAAAGGQRGSAGSATHVTGIGRATVVSGGGSTPPEPR